MIDCFNGDTNAHIIRFFRNYYHFLRKTWLSFTFYTEKTVRFLEILSLNQVLKLYLIYMRDSQQPGIVRKIFNKKKSQQHHIQWKIHVHGLFIIFTKWFAVVIVVFAISFKLQHSDISKLSRKFSFLCYTFGIVVRARSVTLHLCGVLLNRVGSGVQVFILLLLSLYSFLITSTNIILFYLFFEFI